MTRNYTVRIDGKRYETTHIRRFLNHIRTIKWEKPTIEVYVRVSYGQEKDHKGKTRTFYNDGFYEDKEKFAKALKAFLE